MKHSLREMLAESHVSVVAIAVLVLWFFDLGFRALWGPLWRIVTFLFTAIAILDIPYVSPKLGVADRAMLFSTFLYSIEAVMSFAGPSHCLAGCMGWGRFGVWSSAVQP